MALQVDSSRKSPDRSDQTTEVMLGEGGVETAPTPLALVSGSPRLCWEAGLAFLRAGAEWRVCRGTNAS